MTATKAKLCSSRVATRPRWKGLKMDDNQLAALLGHAALKVWPDLPREAQDDCSQPPSTTE
jgi:hypothetical protein